MTATAHSLIGAAIVTKIPDPAISLPLAFLSHFVMDKIPHWDIMTNHPKSPKRIVIESAIDVLLGFVLSILIFGFNPLILCAAFLAQLPDWLEIPYTIFGKRFFFTDLNYKIQKWVHDFWFDSRLPAPWGIVTQVIVVILFILLSFRT